MPHKDRLVEPAWTSASIKVQRDIATVFFGLVPSRAVYLGFSAVALLSVLGGFYLASYRLPQRSSETATIETRSRGQSQTEREKLKPEVLPREPLADDMGQTKPEALQAEREKEVISARYKLCISMAQKNFEVTWAANCKSISVQDKKRHEKCIAQVDTKAVCAPLARAFSESCALPPELAGKLNRELEDVKIRCRPESGAASSQ
jgi:hypothetical protein